MPASRAIADPLHKPRPICAQCYNGSFQPCSGPAKFFWLILFYHLPMPPLVHSMHAAREPAKNQHEPGSQAGAFLMNLIQFLDDNGQRAVAVVEGASARTIAN